MNENKMVITYETIFELLRREKDKEALQKLEETFLQDVLDYLKERKKILASQESTLVSPEEKKRNEKQFENIKKLVKEFYDRREKKIINLAIDKNRTGSDLDTSNLLEEEKKLFEELVRLLSENRANVLHSLLNLETLKKPEEKDIKNQRFLGSLRDSKESQREIKKKEENKKEIKKEEKSSLMVRFIHAVPKFIGKELEEYGPFEEEEIANLPREIAKVLIEKGRAGEIEESKHED